VIVLIGKSLTVCRRAATWDLCRVRGLWVFGVWFLVMGIARVSRAVFRVSRKTFAEWDGEEQGRVVGVWFLVMGDRARLARCFSRLAENVFETAQMSTI
jgi:hypothetical protein